MIGSRPEVCLGAEAKDRSRRRRGARALVAVINKDPLSGLSNGFTALGIVIALASGLVIARMLTDQAWLSQTPSWTHMPATHAQEVLRERARRTGRAQPRAFDPDGDGNGSS